MVVETGYPITAGYLDRIENLIREQGRAYPVLNQTADRINHERAMAAIGHTDEVVETIFELWGHATRVLDSRKELSHQQALAQRYVRRYARTALQELGYTLPQTNTKRFFGRFF